MMSTAASSGSLPRPSSPLDIVERMKPYIAEQLAKGVWLQHVTRHMLGLFHGLPGGKLWRRVLSEEASRPGAGLDVLEKAAEQVASPVFSRYRLQPNSDLPSEGISGAKSDRGREEDMLKKISFIVAAGLMLAAPAALAQTSTDGDRDKTVTCCSGQRGR